MRSSVALLLVLTALGCARRPAPLTPREEPAVVLPDGRALSDDELVVRLEAARYVLLGERHDDACIHRLQQKVIEVAADAGLDFAVGLEMVDVDYVAPMRAFNAGRLTLSALRRAVNWEKGWGFDWWLYAPIFESAQRAGVRVESLNVPKRLLALLGGPEATLDISDEVRTDWLAPVVLPPPPEQLAFLQSVFEAHASHLPSTEDRAAAFGRFVRAQSAWDTQMAWAARHVAQRSQRAFVLVGAGHVVNGWGIEHRLATLDPGAPVLSIVPLDDEPSPDQADLFFACPRGKATRPLESSAR